ncbi:MAG: hypothetical protein R3C15_12850 [Thermoleophilia bacterium]
MGERATRTTRQRLATRSSSCSSWHASYEPLLAASSAPVVPRWHSPLLQTELSREGWKLAYAVDLLDRGLVPAIAVNDVEVVRALGRARRPPA